MWKPFVSRLSRCKHLNWFKNWLKPYIRFLTHMTSFTSFILRYCYAFEHIQLPHRDTSSGTEIVISGFLFAWRWIRHMASPLITSETEPVPLSTFAGLPSRLKRSSHRKLGLRLTIILRHWLRTTKISTRVTIRTCFELIICYSLAIWQMHKTLFKTQAP